MNSANYSIICLCDLYYFYFSPPPSPLVFSWLLSCLALDYQNPWHCGNIPLQKKCTPNTHPWSTSSIQSRWCSMNDRYPIVQSLSQSRLRRRYCLSTNSKWSGRLCWGGYKPRQTRGLVPVAGTRRCSHLPLERLSSICWLQRRRKRHSLTRHC